MQFLTFLITSLIIIVTPGPDFVLITKNALTINNRSGRMTS